MTATRTAPRADPLAFCADALSALDAAALRRRVRPLDSGPGTEVLLDGRHVLLLASNNYLGLATHPDVVSAAADAARQWGAGTGAARLVTGGLRLHDELEAALAAFKHTEDAVLFSSGYLANLGTITALLDAGDVVFSDALNHASIIDGCRLSRATVEIYRHADAGHLADGLQRWRALEPSARALVVTDSVFSMDGDIAPLPDLVAVCERYGAILMVDEAHATGVVGPDGRGAVAHFDLGGRVPIVMGTLSKSLGAAGGFVAGRRDLCDLLRNRARAFIFDTALPAPTAAAALAALSVLEREPERAIRVCELAGQLARGLVAAGFAATTPAAAIVPVIIGESEAALALAGALCERGVLVPAIRPPTVAAGTARLRATVMASHTEGDVARAIAAFAQ